MRRRLLFVLLLPLLLLVALLSIVILGLLALLLSRQGPRSGGLFDPQPVHRVASGDTPG